MDNLSYIRHNNISAKITCSTDNVPTSFSTAAGSLVMTGIALARGFAIINTSTSEIAVNYRADSTTTPPSTTLAYCPAAPSGSFATLVMDNVDMGPNIYIKSDTGAAISTGVIRIFVW